MRRTKQREAEERGRAKARMGKKNREGREQGKKGKGLQHAKRIEKRELSKKKKTIIVKKKTLRKTRSGASGKKSQVPLMSTSRQR